MAAHESFQRDEEVKVSSDRTFGLVFTTLFLLIGLAPLRHQLPVRWWAVVLSGSLLLTSALLPHAMGPLNRLWSRFGLLLQKITNPIVMGVLFYALITPVALLFKVLGKDPLNRHFDPKAESYWIKRRPLEPSNESMRQQF